MQNMTTTASTRDTYGKTLVELGRENPDIVVLGGDLNKSTVINLFAEEFPDRFFDLGPAEQNMMSVAAGLASSGKTVFASTFAVFGSGRPYDQIRIGISQARLNVKIVVTHAGITTGEDGMSAHGIEDLSLMCALPSFTVIVPADGPETALAVRKAAESYGPFYIRLSRPATPVVHEGDYDFKIGQSELLRDGGDATIIACGTMVNTALTAATDPGQRGYPVPGSQHGDPAAGGRRSHRERRQGDGRHRYGGGALAPRRAWKHRRSDAG